MDIIAPNAWELERADRTVTPQIEDHLFIEAQSKQRSVKTYLCDKRTSMIVVAQLSPDCTAALVDRWDEPSRSKAKPDRKPATINPRRS